MGTYSVRGAHEACLERDLNPPGVQKMHQIRDHEHDEVRKPWYGWQCLLRWDRQKSSTESWEMPLFKGNTKAEKPPEPEDVQSEKQANRSILFYAHQGQRMARSWRGRTEMEQRPQSWANYGPLSVSEGNVRSASQMEGGRELKPLMGNEAERGGERKALSLDRETGLRRFFFFFSWQGDPIMFVGNMGRNRSLGGWK